MLNERVEFNPQQEDDFSAYPATPAVFLLRGDAEAAEPYISKTANLRRRLERLLGKPAEGSRRLNLRSQTRWIEFTQTGSDFAAGFLLYRLLRQVLPDSYERRLRLRPAPLIKFHMSNPYPRASVTTRIGRTGSESCYYGPFPSRAAAEKLANDVLDFFKMRRCVENLNPDPAFPGCIYSEMKMCLAPCFKGCTDEEYASEVGRVRDWFDSAGDSLVREIASARDQAAANLEFESAAALHDRVEKVKLVAREVPEIVQRLDRLVGVIVQPSAVPECVDFFALRAGRIVGSVKFSIAPPEHTKSQSMESRIGQALQEVIAEPSGNMTEIEEHLAILKRWFYRSNRAGEIFLADEKGNLPMRRLVRGVGRVLRGEKISDAELQKPGQLGPAEGVSH